MKIAQKLPLAMVSLALAAAAITGFIGYFKSADQLEEAVFSKLEGQMQTRRGEISSYLNGIVQDLDINATNQAVVEALKQMQDSFQSIQLISGNATEHLQAAYIKENPNPEGQRHKLVEAPSDTSIYAFLHTQYHPSFVKMLDTRGYSDFMILTSGGSVVYTAAKNEDFAVRVSSDAMKDTALNQIFELLKKDPKPGQVVVTDFARYKPARDAIVSFAAMPIFDGVSEFLGVLVIQIPVSDVNKVMQVAVGLGKTGETYLVGTDGGMRSDSRFVKEGTALKVKIDNLAVKEGLSGKSGVTRVTGRDGQAKLSAFGGIEFRGVRWAVLAEQSISEALAPVSDTRNFMLVAGVLVLLISVGVGLFVASGVSNPISDMTDAMNALANGNTDAEIPAVGREDEIGHMASAVVVFRQNAIEVKRMDVERQEMDRRASEERRQGRHSMAGEFENAMAGVVSGVSSVAEQIQATAKELSEMADQVGNQAAEVSSAASESSVNVNTVAAAAEELSASVNEISRQVLEASNVSKTAVEEAAHTNELVQSLSQAAGRIGEVVKLINDIAGQTNLLALNATIEAARAGDAGKGFAVVAGEVKNLANQTSKATDEIGAQINAVQAATEEAVSAIRAITATIGRIDGIAEAIAAAVEEQGVTTREIASNIQQAAAGSQHVSQSVAGVNEAVDRSRQGASHMLKASGSLASQATSLKQGIESFLSHIRQ
jgi:methyl-accepting chemotaxis protein